MILNHTWACFHARTHTQHTGKQSFQRTVMKRWKRTLLHPMHPLLLQRHPNMTSWWWRRYVMWQLRGVHPTTVLITLGYKARPRQAHVQSYHLHKITWRDLKELWRSLVYFPLIFQAKARSSFFKQAKSYPMFPCKEEKVKWDDYGEPIRWVLGLFKLNL